MVKKKLKYSNVTLTLDSYLGESKRYHFFFVKSDLDFYPFALQLNKQLSCSLSYSGAFSPVEDSLKAVFCFLASPILGVNKGDVFVVENKTINYDQKFFDEYRKENKPVFQTLTLFKEYCYLFGSKSPVLWKFPNKMETSMKEFYDYIIIISHDKENYLVNDFLENIKNTRLYSVTDIYKDIEPYIYHNLKEGQPAKKRKGKKNAIDFLLELCQIVEITRNDFEAECMKKLLGNKDIIKEIPQKNQTFPLPDEIKMPVQIEKDHIISLSKDITFE